MSRPCPVCGVLSEPPKVYAQAKIDPGKLNEFAFASRKTPEFMHHRLVLCSSCELLYADPAPDPAATQKAYEEAAFDTSEEARFAAITYAEALDAFLKELPDRAGALDVGTGDGAFLEELLQRKFTNVIGVEPSEAPIRSASARVRPLIRKGYFTAESFPPESVSLFSCFQTLEHLHDPASLCREALRLLKPGGAFFAVCHDRLSLVNRLLGRKSPIFDIEHLQLFSPKSVRRLLETSGFQRVRVQPLVNRYPLRYWIKLLPLGAAARRWALSAADRAGIGGRTLSFGVGNLAVVGFKS